MSTKNTKKRIRTNARRRKAKQATTKVRRSVKAFIGALNNVTTAFAKAADSMSRLDEAIAHMEALPLPKPTWPRWETARIEEARHGVYPGRQPCNEPTPTLPDTSHKLPH